jgi:phosphonate transport system permease protein
VLALAASVQVGEVRPDRFVEGIGGLFDYIDRTLPKATGGGLIADAREWYWGLGRWLRMLFDTVVIAALATTLGAAAGFALCFPASRNLMRNAAAVFVSRRLLEVARAVPELVYALIFVFAFGIGPLAGVLAIAIHTAGSLGKLFSEVNENVDVRPIEGVRAVGGNWFQAMRYGVVPQVLPNFVSYALLRFEINVRSAAIIGFVGAGGIGQELYLVIRQFIYADISALVILIVLAVSLIDLGCERLRHGLIGRESLA